MKPNLIHFQSVNQVQWQVGLGKYEHKPGRHKSTRHLEQREGTVPELL